MLIFCQKKRSFSWRHYALMFFFQISHEPQSCHIHIWIKNVNFDKTTRYNGLKKLIGCPFFQFFTNKYQPACPHFVQNDAYSQKARSLMPIFCQKNVHSLKNTVFHLIFDNFPWKTTNVMSIFGPQNFSSVKNKGKKSQ